MLLFLLACNSPIEAPTELNELTRYIFREFEAEDPVGLGAAADNLAPWFEDIPEDGYLLDVMSDEDVAGIDRPDRDIAAALSIGVMAPSDFPVDAHTRYMLETDLLSISPSAVAYERTFLTDTDCFPDRGCEFLRTSNDITRSNILVTMSFTLSKDIRWVTLESGEPILLSRGWIAESAIGEDGNNILWQSYEIEAWLPRDDGGSWRLMALWSEVDYVGVSEDIALSSARMGIEDAFQAQDDYLSEVP